MDEQLKLLERMASISPGVQEHIGGRIWLEHIDEDEITHQTLVNECFSIMIDEAYELGIEFFCTLGDLCESLYVIDKTLLFFEVVFPTPLYRSITESDAFKLFISTVAVDGVSIDDESSAQTILEYLAINNEKTSSIFLDTYTFLQDKMKSTPVFDNYIRSTLDIDNTPFSSEVNDETINNYLEDVQNTFTTLLKAADALYNGIDSKEAFVTLYDDIQDYKVKATDISTLECYSWAREAKINLTKLPMVQMFIEKYHTQFCASVPFFEEFFILRKEPVLINNIVTLILGAYLNTKTKDAFLAKTTDMFSKLQANGNIILNDMNFLIQKINLAIVQEYYP